MMKAAVMDECRKPLIIKEINIPKPRPDEVLIKMIACGVCHSDLHLLNDDWNIPAKLPRILGHEGIGEIVQLGSNAADRLKLGDVVGIPWLRSTCTHCEYCLTGRETLCLNKLNTSIHMDGCFAEYALIDADFAMKLPEGMDPYTSAPLFCAGVTVYKALKVAEVRPGQWVSIVGIGGLGSLAVQYAKVMGLQVAAVVAPDDHKCAELAKTLGADKVYNGPSDEHAQWIRSNLDGIQTSIVCVSSAQAYEQAIKSVKRGGRVIAVGLPSEDISLSILQLVAGGIQLIGSGVGTRQDLKEALELAKLHGILCPVNRRKLQDINEIFEDMLQYKIVGRIVIDFRND